MSRSLLHDTLALHNKFLDAYSENADDFVTDALEIRNSNNIDATLIPVEDAPLDDKLFMDLCEEARQYDLEDAELRIRNLLAFVSRTPTNDLYNIGGLTFRHGRYFTGSKLKLVLPNKDVLKTEYHSVILIDNYIYDILLGINGIPVKEYLQYLYTFNSSLGVLVPHSNYLGFGTSTEYLTRLQYAAFCGVLGPTYKQYISLGEVDLDNLDTSHNED